MKKAFYRLKKFYIPMFVLIILISLSYIFLHRPLGLIIWDKLYYEEEKKLILDDLYAVWGNEKEFIKYYNDFYLKENIAEKSKKTKMELLDNIKYFHFDFNEMKIFGLDKFYLQALMDKSDLYWADSGWNISYWVYNNQMDKIQINDISKYIEF